MRYTSDIFLEVNSKEQNLVKVKICLFKGNTKKLCN